jgi:uncharacterized protein
MNCPETARLLNPYVDGELDLTTALAIEEHVHGCARCRASLDGLQATRAAIGRHCEFRPAPDSLDSRLRRRVAHERQGGWRAALRSPLAIATPGVAALLLAGWVVLADVMKGGAPPVATQTRVVYHISSGEAASPALRNLANHLQAAPGVKVVVVAHNDGVDFLLRGARDESGLPYETAVKSFSQRGVEFRVCYNTLERRQIASSEVIREATLVPSGIAEIGRLQSSEGYVYMRL